MESSFYQNVFLLTQAVPPSKEFLKYFKEGMFDKPNTVGFLHMSHYLLTIYDAERFKKLLQWPVFCKKTEAKYRTDVKDFLTAVASENRDVDFPQILASHLLHAGGTRFSIIMWKLSTVVLRTYIGRETEAYLGAPKSGIAEDVAKTMLNNSIKRSTRCIEDIDTDITKMEREAEQEAKEIVDFIQKNEEDLFLTKQSMMNLVTTAHVHPEMKKRLVDLNDSEVVQLWKNSTEKAVKYLKSKQLRLNKIAEHSSNVGALVTSIASADTNLLDGTRLPNIDIDSVSETEGLSPETQVILHRLYVNGTLDLEHFLLLFCDVLVNIRRYLENHKFPDISVCDSQVRASHEDVRSMCDLFQALHDRIGNLSSEIKNGTNQDCHRINTYPSPMGNNIFDSVLLKSSPIIHINMNANTDSNDINERLELTPVENTNIKVLFSRHKRHKDLTPQTLTKLRPKLLVSRINFEETRSSNISDRLSPTASRGTNSRMMNLLSTTNSSDKYSRLFTSFQRKPSSAFNSTATSLTGYSRLNSIADMNSTCDVYNFSELPVHVSTKSKFGNRDMYNTPPKRNAERASSTLKDEDKRITTTKASRSVVEKTTENTMTARQSPKIRQSDKQIDRSRRVSISDLVERYKNLHKSRNVVAHFENSSETSDESGKQ